MGTNGDARRLLRLSLKDENTATNQNLASGSLNFLPRTNFTGSKITSRSTRQSHVGGSLNTFSRSDFGEPDIGTHTEPLCHIGDACESFSSTDCVESGLTEDVIDAIDDLESAIDISIEYDIDIEHLNTVEECKERFHLHLEKIKQVSSKKEKIEKSMIKAGEDDARKREKLRGFIEHMLSIIHKDTESSSTVHGGHELITDSFNSKSQTLDINSNNERFKESNVQNDNTVNSNDGTSVYRREKPTRASDWRGSEFVENLLSREGTSRNLVQDCEAHLAAMDDRELMVIIAGETSAGKSSVLNLLFEDDILPVFNNSSTSTITIVRYHQRRHCRLVYKDDTSDLEFDLDEAGLKRLQAVAFMRSASERENHNIKEVQVYLPLPILQSGLVLVDTPGIGENEYLETELINFISTHHIRGFMYIIKTDNAGGVQEDRLLGLLKIVIEKQKLMNRDSTSSFNPGAALFVCNRVDLIKPEELEKVKQNAIEKLSECWPGFVESQVVFFSTSRCQRDIQADGDYINANYRQFLDALKDLFITGLEKRIKISYKWLETVLKRTVHHLKSVVSRLDMNDFELKTKSENVSEKLTRLQLKSDSVLKEVGVKLAIESNDLCKFLKDNLLSNQFKDKLVKDWSMDVLPKVDSGLGNWNWIKIKIQEAFLDRVMSFINMLENGEERVENVEQTVLYHIKFELKLLEEELLDIEKEISGESSSDSSISELSKTRRRSTLTLSPSRYKYMVTQPPLPLKLAGRLAKPFRVAVDPMINRHKVKKYKENPLGIAEECARKFYDDLCQQSDEDAYSGLAQIADILLERPREYIETIRRKIPDMVFSNQLLLNQIEENIGTERLYQSQYEEMMTSTEVLRRSLMEYGEGYIFVNDFSRGELQIEQMHPDTGDRVSVAFNVVDFLRGSSGDLDTAKMRDIRGLWTVTYGGLLMRNGSEIPVAIRVYLPSSGVECTNKEVAKLRCLTCRGTGIAEFLGIHNARAPTPAFVYEGALRSVRRFMQTFCSKRNVIPEILEGTASGLEYLHNKGLVHMELTQDTVTVDEFGTVQLTGACLPRKPTLPERPESIKTGTFVYLAPEILRGDTYEPTADIYSFGLMVLELMTVEWREVFENQRRMTLYDFTQNVNPEEMLDLERSMGVFTVRSRALVQNCLEIDKNDRPLMSEVVEYASYLRRETEALDKITDKLHGRRRVIKTRSYRSSARQSTKL